MEVIAYYLNYRLLTTIKLYAIQVNKVNYYQVVLTTMNYIV